MASNPPSPGRLRLAAVFYFLAATVFFLGGALGPNVGLLIAGALCFSAGAVCAVRWKRASA